MKNYFGMNNLKAIILAAGEGKRLRPLTDDRPKTMVKLFGMSLLERQIITLNNCGINDIVVVGGYKDETIIFPNGAIFRDNDFESSSSTMWKFNFAVLPNRSLILSGFLTPGN